MSPRFRRRPAPAHLVVESLEPRLALAGDVGGEPDPLAVTPTLVICPPPPSLPAAPAEPFTTGLPEADADRPWIELATGAETGAIVIWVRIAGAGGVPTVQTLPVWGRLNGADVDGADPVAAACAESTVSGRSPDDSLASVTGWVFGGAGTDPAVTWPQPLETFTAAAPPADDGVQDYFLVLQSPSDQALGLATAVAVIAGAPGAGFGSEPEGVDGPPTAEEPLPLGGLLLPGRAAPPSGILPDDADAAAWLRDARGAETGSFVLWSGTTGGVPMVVPLFVKFNPSAADDPLFDPAETRRRAARFYPADGGPALPWPAAFGDSFVEPAEGADDAPSGDAVRPPAADLPPGPGYLVVHTDSNFEILLATLFIPLVMRGVADGSGPDGIATLFGTGPGVIAPPPAPTVALLQDTGVDTDGITADGRLAVGTAADGRVEYSTDDGRTWGAEFVAVEGLNRVAVRQVDPFGQASPETRCDFTLDTRAAAPRIALADGTRPSAGNPLRRQAELAIRGLEPAARVEYSVAGGPWVGAWQAVEGQNAVRVRQIDVAGNTSEPSAELRFRIDSQVEPLTVQLARDTGWSGTDRVTTDPTLVLGGREAGAAVRYSIDGGVTWSGRFFPQEGRNVLVVRQVDEAGNVSAATRFSFTLDRVPPPRPVVLSSRGRARAFAVAGQPDGTRLEYAVGGGWTTDIVTTAGPRGGVRVRFVDRAGNASVASAPLRGGIRPG